MFKLNFKHLVDSRLTHTHTHTHTQTKKFNHNIPRAHAPSINYPWSSHIEYAVATIHLYEEYYTCAEMQVAVSLEQRHRQASKPNG